ncbi:hypothetical protein NL300_28725, partial [Klebsiella pneumoniae]|nr:hypothetical protein [Klebsiella pneumoniae]
AKVLESHESKIKLVGYDLISQNIDYIKKRIITYAIGQRPENQGYTALNNFYKNLIAKKSVEDHTYLPLDIVTQENMMY